MMPYFMNCGLFIVPLRYEAGTRFKILEAGACCLPVLSTTLGAEGLPLVSGEHIMIADSPKEFIEAAKELINSPALRIKLAKNLRQVVINGFGIDALAEQGKHVLSKLLD